MPPFLCVEILQFSAESTLGNDVVIEPFISVVVMLSRLLLEVFCFHQQGRMPSQITTNSFLWCSPFVGNQRLIISVVLVLCENILDRPPVVNRIALKRSSLLRCFWSVFSGLPLRVAAL